MELKSNSNIEIFALKNSAFVLNKLQNVYRLPKTDQSTGIAVSGFFT